MADSKRPRVRKMEDQIQKILSQILHKEISDPRLKMLTISGVKASGDLSYARVYVSSVVDVDSKEVMAALDKAKGHLRSQLSKQLTTRFVPNLTFIYDRSAEEGDYISKLIHKALGKS